MARGRVLALLLASLAATAPARAADDSLDFNLALFRLATIQSMPSLAEAGFTPAACVTGGCDGGLDELHVGGQVDFTLPYLDVPLSAFAGLAGGLDSPGGGVAYSPNGRLEFRLWAEAMPAPVEDESVSSFGLSGILRF